MSRPPMWFDSLPSGRSWVALWSGYTTCGVCFRIRFIEHACQTCGDPAYSREPVVVEVQGGSRYVVPPAVTGAEGRYEDWIYLQMLEREWKRPLNDAERLSTLDGQGAPSPRAAIVIVFWSYFETRLERLLRAGMRTLPPAVLEDMLQRYSTIGSRLDRLYKVLFATTYFEDLVALGYANVRDCLARVHRGRNEFAHGNPRALDNALVSELVGLLKAEHESWIAIFNHRTATRQLNQV